MFLRRKDGTYQQWLPDKPDRVVTLEEDQVLPESDKVISVTAKMTPRTISALEQASEIAGDTRTDTINRAIQLYDFVISSLAQNPGDQLFIEQNGKLSYVYLS